MDYFFLFEFEPGLGILKIKCFILIHPIVFAFDHTGITIFAFKYFFKYFYFSNTLKFALAAIPLQNNSFHEMVPKQPNLPVDKTEKVWLRQLAEAVWLPNESSYHSLQSQLGTVQI